MADLICFENRYQIGQEVLGEGAFGLVVKGVDIVNRNYVACKIVDIKKLQKTPKLGELFAQEITLQQSLDSPFCVKLYKVYKVQDKFFVILECCEGGDLDNYVKKKGPLPEQETIGFLLQILAGFRELHSKSIIHRDLKPANILLHGKQLKIADFGASRTVLEGNEAETKIGTPYFLAPEIQEGLDYGFEVDIFSLGVLVYFMLFNDYPYKGGTALQVYNNMKAEQIDFKKNGVFISGQMQDFIKRLLRFNRDQRITWAQIYQHPIVTKNMKNDNISAEIIIAPSSADIKMYQNPKFSNKKAGSEMNQSTQLASIKADEQKPKPSNKEEDELYRKLAAIRELIVQDFVAGIKLYVHKKNIYGVLLHLALTFKQLSNLKINYQIPAYLVQKKLRSLNFELLQAVKEKKNIFNMEFFNEFVETDYYKRITEMVVNDTQQTEAYMVSTQKDAQDSMAKLNINNQSLKDEISKVDLTNKFQEHLLGSLISYGDGLQKSLRNATDKTEKQILFVHTVLVYQVCCIDKLFKNDIDYDFEKHKNQLIQIDPSKYQETIEKYLAKVFD